VRRDGWKEENIVGVTAAKVYRVVLFNAVEFRTIILLVLQ
jgi:hypothetical protein